MDVEADAALAQLHDADFERRLLCSRQEYSELQPWRQRQLRRIAGIQPMAVGAPPPPPPPPPPPLVAAAVLADASSSAQQWKCRHSQPNRTITQKALDSGAIVEAVAPTSRWNRRVLFLARGYQEPGRPRSTGLVTEDRFVSHMVDQGWIVAATSYYAQGKVVGRGAVRDLLDLHEWICATWGAPGLSLLEGRSMGGAIATLAAEGQYGSRGLFDGVYTSSAALR